MFEQKQVVKGLALLLPLQVVLPSRPDPAPTLFKVVHPDHYQAVALSSRQRLKKGCMYHVEDRGVGANTEGEREYSDGGEARRFAQHAQAVTHVLHKLFEPSPAPRDVAFFL